MHKTQIVSIAAIFALSAGAPLQAEEKLTRRLRGSKNLAVALPAGKLVVFDPLRVVEKSVGALLEIGLPHRLPKPVRPPPDLRIFRTPALQEFPLRLQAHRRQPAVRLIADKERFIPKILYQFTIRDRSLIAKGSDTCAMASGLPNHTQEVRIFNK